MAFEELREKMSESQQKDASSTDDNVSLMANGKKKKAVVRTLTVSAADLSSGGSVQPGVTSAPLQTTQHRKLASAQEINTQNSHQSAAKLALA